MISIYACVGQDDVSASAVQLITVIRSDFIDIGRRSWPGIRAIDVSIQPPVYVSAGDITDLSIEFS
jgi:hypothetical protein